MNTSSMVLFLAVTSNIFGAVFARLGTAEWITRSLLALPLPPMVMLLLVLVLIFLLGWPFEWLPSSWYSCRSSPGGAGAQLQPGLFGALVAVTMQTAFLSRVAMSAYY